MEKGFEDICKQCLGGFSTPSIMKRHMRTHSGEKSFMCKQCTKHNILRNQQHRNIYTINKSNSNFIPQTVRTSNELIAT